MRSARLRPRFFMSASVSAPSALRSPTPLSAMRPVYWPNPKLSSSDATSMASWLAAASSLSASSLAALSESLPASRGTGSPRISEKCEEFVGRIGSRTGAARTRCAIGPSMGTSSATTLKSSSEDIALA